MNFGERFRESPAAVSAAVGIEAYLPATSSSRKYYLSHKHAAAVGCVEVKMAGYYHENASMAS
jgi:hypothetical protein